MQAIISVANKSGLAEFGRGLAGLGVDVIATGGTAAALQAAGVDVTPVEQITGFPELLGGRVKTLHPAIHAAILAPRDDDGLSELAAHGITPVDLVVCNLYPFEDTVARPDATLEQAVEQIDIGGVTLLRAAAKNAAYVAAVVDPADYGRILEELQGQGAILPTTRAALALKAFRHTAAYDSAIAAYLGAASAADDAHFPDTLPLVLRKAQDLRYGENPHQAGALYRVPGRRGLADARQLHGKGLSFTNVLDIDTAWSVAYGFSAPAVAIIKHATPCGVATAARQVDAYRAALASDPVSAFGGVIGLNQPVAVETAEAIAELFVEAIIAPSFGPEAESTLKQRESVRLIAAPFAPPDTHDIRVIHGSAVAQTPDPVEREPQREVVTRREPTGAEWRGLLFAWQVVQSVKSNAIVFARDTATVGIGTGQPSRVDSVRLAAWKAGDEARGAVMASDAFFPFPDGILEAAAAGITAVIQPGGSIRDDEVIRAADEHTMAMVFTGTRHFRH
jgi:phosphoribosylaminoimidazolecarboxamide formyltransferase/IMP cyclohydrolase